ncbi:lipid-A-disaccharide synthase, partial [Salmonella enterica subsp. enterica serovar Poona]
APAPRPEPSPPLPAEAAPARARQLPAGMAREAMIASDAALLASGTAALECMLANCPMVVGWRVMPVSFWLGKRRVVGEEGSW